MTIIISTVTLWCKYCDHIHCVAEEQADCVLQTESLSRGTDMLINNYNAVIGT